MRCCEFLVVEAVGDHEGVHRGERPEGCFHAVTDASREEPLLLIKSAFQLLRLVWRIRPDVVITTGAAPGLFGLLFGWLGVAVL